MYCETSTGSSERVPRLAQYDDVGRFAQRRSE